MSEHAARKDLMILKVVRSAMTDKGGTFKVKDAAPQNYRAEAGCSQDAVYDECRSKG
ncbi:hypothetical protein CRBSH125_23870 [Afipia carboxidovorans]|nr:hypothetical protein CRBSH125_23870 [Afipia carboxidovorans]